MLKICSIFLWFLPVLFFAEEVQVEKYRWPLNINNGYSSSFQEFRNSHFHAGIDLRTYQKTGYPVYALADGKVVKIRVVKRGSGRGLYLKHHDGHTSIFFHLDRFIPALEKIVKRVQGAAGKKYFGNYDLKNPFPVKKDDLIAYSGETGYGFPHLHLEIRDPQYRAVNPFKLIKLPANDSNFPVLKSLLLRNKSESLINGRVGESWFKFNRASDSLYYLKEPLVVTGRFDLLLNTRDISDTGKYVAPYEISLFINDRNTFCLRFDRFAWEDNNQLGFVYDMFYSSSGNFFYNLFFQNGFEMEMNKLDLDSVFDQLDVGRHECKILVKDNYENMSTGIFTLYKIEMPLIEIENLALKDNRIELDIIRLKARSSDEVVLDLLDFQGKKLYSGKLDYSEIDEPRNLVLDGIMEKVFFLDFIFKKQGVVYGSRRFCLDKDYGIDLKNIEFETFINRDVIFLMIDHPRFLAENTELNVIQGERTISVKPFMGPENLYFCFKPLSLANDIQLEFLLKRENEIVKSFSHRLRVIHLIRETKQTFRDNDFRADFFPKAIKEPKVLKFDIVDHDSQFPVLSRQVSLYPYHFPFLDYVYYQFSKLVENPLQVGIFKFDSKRRKWRYVFTSYDEQTYTYKIKVIASGIFALMRDIYPPEIKLAKTGSRFKSKIKRIILKITDKGKGVNDGSLRVLVNGQRVECEYDPDWRHVIIQDVRNLARGRNVIKASVSDYAGNVSSRNFNIFLN